MADWTTYAEGKRSPELPVLFLDVDGVLNCVDDFKAGYSLCQRKVLLLNKLPPCDIVISSTWRIGTYPHLVAALRWLGCKRNVVGYTPQLQKVVARVGDNDIFSSETRGAEIDDWLGRNGRPQFAIVDDDSDMLPEHKPRFVQTTFQTGLTVEHIERLGRILTNQ